jgi:hypothetical protein
MSIYVCNQTDMLLCTVFDRLGLGETVLIWKPLYPRPACPLEKAVSVLHCGLWFGCGHHWDPISLCLDVVTTGIQSLCVWMWSPLGSNLSVFGCGHHWDPISLCLDVITTGIQSLCVWMWSPLGSNLSVFGCGHHWDPISLCLIYLSQVVAKAFSKNGIFWLGDFPAEGVHFLPLLTSLQCDYPMVQ